MYKLFEILFEVFQKSLTTKNGTFSITFRSKKDFARGIRTYVISKLCNVSVPRFFIPLIAKDMQTKRKSFFSLRQKHDYTG